MEDILIHSLQTEGTAACALLLEPVILKRRAVLSEKMGLLQTTLGSTVESIFGDSAWDAEANPDPFENLPSPIMVKLLETFFEIYPNKKELLDPKKMQLVHLMLQRCNSVDLDFTDWRIQPSNGEKLMDLLMGLSPELQRLVDTSHITGPQTHVMWSKNTVDSEFSAEHIEECTHHSPEMQALKEPQWQKMSLQSVKITLPIHCQMGSTPIWENIRFLGIYFPIYHFECFDTANLEGLNNLKEMHIKLKFIEFSKQDTIVPKLLELVQHLPSLEILGCNSLHQHLQLGAQFVTEFGQHAVSERALLVDRLDVGWQHVPDKWPDNLRIRNLNVYNPASQRLVDKILSMPTDKLEELKLENVVHGYFGSLVDALAPGVTKIKIGGNMAVTVDLYRVLNVAPQVVDIEIDMVRSAFVDLPLDLLDKVCVKTMKRFVIHNMPFGNSAAVLKLFENFLKFSEAYEELEFSDEETLDVALATFKQHPACGARMRRLKLNLMDSMQHSKMIPKGLELAAILTFRSPFMEKVIINSSNSFGDFFPTAKCQWFQDLADCLEVKFEVPEPVLYSIISDGTSWKIQ